MANPPPDIDPFASLNNIKSSNTQPSLSTSKIPHNVSSQTILSAKPSSSIHSSSRQPSPQPFQHSVAPGASTSTSLLDLTQPASHLINQPSNGNAAEEEWTFASALPEQPSQITVLNSSIQVVFHVNREQNKDSDILIQSRISNNSAQFISNLTFQIAVSKVCFVTCDLYGLAKLGSGIHSQA